MATGVSLEWLLERLAPAGVTARRMFGGHGLWLGDQYFGIVNGGRVYFRTDEESRAAYLERGMTAFQPPNRPRGPKTVDRTFEVPAEVLADPAQLVVWAVRAAEAAARDRSRRKK